MSLINRVVIVGGTHGNELTGIYLVKKFERSPQLIQRKSFTINTIIANPKAFEIGRRYVDTDLNRCFQRSCLQNPNLASYEAQRAKVIYSTFGTGGSQQADLVIDLHSTTSNMGLTFILASKHPFDLQLAAYISCVNPKVRILCSAPKTQDNCYLDSICQFGCTIEVGAVAQGVLDANLFQKTEELISTILDYVEIYNHKASIKIKDTFTIYQSIKTVDYPRNEVREIRAMIHPRLQFRDYEALHPGEPMFLTFDGKEIIYEGESTVYPVFINEAAYYEKGVAMSLTQKIQEILPES
ncbi:MAG: aspartoacylase [Desmonostoc vinosum HA7617-LM4]|jgi:aspartoacylase|nr:aspartoacylase [Desmonostoc vinosum HA7617-LM4]